MKKALSLCLWGFILLSLFAQTADPWVNPVYLGGGMSIVAKVKINGQDATTQDILTAFVGNELRAKTNLVSYTAPVNGVGRAFLIQTATPNEVITFQVWDYSSQKIYICSTTLNTIPGSSVGSYPSNIYTINCEIETASIKGYVTLDSSPLENIQMVVSNSTFNFQPGNFISDKTNQTGYYVLPGIPIQSTLTMRPQNALYSFTPAYQNYYNIQTDQNQNFQATLLMTYSVSGFVLINGSGLSGVTISSGENQVVTDQNGFYSFNLVEGFSYSLTASKPGFQISPSQIQINNLQNELTNQNFQAEEITFSLTGNTTAPQTLISVQSAQQINYPPVTSDLTGQYSMNGIKYNDSIVVTPVKTGYTFNPEFRSFSSVTSNQICNFNASVTQYTVSGFIYSNNMPLQNVIIRYGNQQTMTNLNGFYSFSLPYNSTITITPIKTGFLFSPQSYTINSISSNQSISFTASPLPVYTLSGLVRMSDNTPAAACTVYTQNETTLTDESGFYSLPQHQTSDPVQIFIKKYGYHFLPEYQIVNGVSQDNSGLNFTAIYNNYSVSGMITGTDSVTISVSGDVNQILNTGSQNGYSIQNIPYLSNISITPSKPHYQFIPPIRNISLLPGDLINQNFSAIIDQYQITVMTSDQGSPLSNVQINYNGNIGYTGVNGILTFNVNHGSNCTLQASKPGYYFTTPTITLNNITSPQTVHFITRDPIFYTISGFVLDSNQNPVNGVAIQSNFPTVYTNAQGFYSFSVPENANVQIIPFKIGYQFNPIQVTLTSITQNHTQNFSAYVSHLLISGTVLFNNLGLPNVLIRYNGNIIQTNANGEYEFSLPYGSSLVIRASRAGYTFQPDSISYSSVTSDLDYCDFTAQKIIFHISGTVRSNGQPMSNVLISSDQDALEILTDLQGHYNYPVEYGEDIVLYPHKAGYGFSPDSLVFMNVMTNHEMADFDAIPKVNEVVFTPNPGIYYAPVNIVLSCSLSGVSIYYTEDGTEPDFNAILYTQPIPIPLRTSKTIRARAYKNSYLPSDITVGVYQVTGQTYAPQVNLDSGIYTHAIHIVLTSSDSALIYYTLDGTEPDQSDSLYYHPIPLNKNCILKAKSYRENYLPSQTVSYYYNFNHLINLNLPDSVYINQASSLTLNLQNYTTDSVEGDPNYNITVSSSENIISSLNGMLLTLSSGNDWYGEEVITINIEYNDNNNTKKIITRSASDTMKVMIIPANYPPEIVFYQPQETIIEIEQDKIINFIVMGSDPDSPVFYSWYVNNVEQGSHDSYFSYFSENSGTYTIRCQVTDNNSSAQQSWVIHVTSDVNDNNDLPLITKLGQNYPNPFNPDTSIRFSLAKDDHIRLEIYDLKGRKIKVLSQGYKKRGHYLIKWDGLNDAGHKVSSGIYLYKLTGSDFIETKKAVMLK